MPPSFLSPFAAIDPTERIASNQFAFAIKDKFPVSPGHSLVVTKRVVETWFEASPDEQIAVMNLVNEVRDLLTRELSPVPDGFNVGFNTGIAAGQTIHHLHVHVIPRYSGDVPDPRGGIRNVIPDKGNYLTHQTQTTESDESSPPSN